MSLQSTIAISEYHSFQAVMYMKLNQNPRIEFLNLSNTGGTHDRMQRTTPGLQEFWIILDIS